MDDLVGRTLGPYELLDRIGAGGMATVYRGVHRALDQPRAIKILLPSLAADESLVERFRSEAKIASGLRHPHVVSIYDVGEQDGLFYLVMDLVEGESLFRLLRREKTLDPGRTVRVLRQLASALDYAHGRGVLHRDIKASNVLIGVDDHVSLFDFGIARAAASISRLTIPGQVVGTPEYLAPEVIVGAEGDRRADFYALGVLAYQMLAGRLPFSGMDTMALLYAQVSTMPPSLCAIRPEIPVAAEQVVMRQMAKAPEERYPTADSFVSALSAAMPDRATPGPRTPPSAPRPAAPEPPRPGQRAADPASRTSPGLADDRTTPLPAAHYRRDEEAVTPLPQALPAAFDPGNVTIPPDPLYRPEPRRVTPAGWPARDRPPASRLSDGRADLVPRRTALPRPFDPEPEPQRGVGLLPIAVVVLGLVFALAVASGQLDSVLGIGDDPPSKPAQAQPTAVASTSSGATPSVAAAVPSPVAALPTAVPAPTIAALPPATAPGVAPPSQGAGPAATPDATAVPEALAALPPSAEQQIATALAQIEGGEHAAALSLLLPLQESAPDTEGLSDALYRAHLGHGQQQLERGLIDESYAAYGEALKLRPDDPAALEGQKHVVLAKHWNTMEAAWGQDDAAATTALEEILTLDAGYRDANQKLYALLVAQGTRLLEADDVDGALTVLRRADEVYPDGNEARALIQAHTPTATPEPAPEPAPERNPPPPPPPPAPQPAPKPAAPESQPLPVQPQLPVPELPALPKPGGLPLPRP